MYISNVRTVLYVLLGIKCCYLTNNLWLSLILMYAGKLDIAVTLQVAMRVVSPQQAAHRTRSYMSESSIEMPSPLLYQDTPLVLKPHPSTLTPQDRPEQRGGVRKKVQQLEYIRSHTPQPQRPTQVLSFVNINY